MVWILCGWGKNGLGCFIKKRGYGRRVHGNNLFKIILPNPIFGIRELCRMDKKYRNMSCTQDGRNLFCLFRIHCTIIMSDLILFLLKLKENRATGSLLCH
jgi:hypothetical protein